MKFKIFLLITLINLPQLSVCQTIQGRVIDAVTKTPIEAAAVYFDNTTVGTTTNSDGVFTLSYAKKIKSPLVISFLGYKKQVINDYKVKGNIEVLLEEQLEALNKVVITANDGMSRRQKLNYFKREFLGTSRFANTCKILNEDDIVLKYNKKERILTGYSKASLIIENTALQYLINYDVSTFTLKFYPLNSENHPFDAEFMGFMGTSFYKDLTIFNEKKAKKNRTKAYSGSRLQFVRALYDMKIEERGYQLFDGKTKIEPQEYSNYFSMETNKETGIKRLTIVRPLKILYKNWEKSIIIFQTPSIFIDQYGNYTDADQIRFSGIMGEQRVGELLPFDYGL